MKNRILINILSTFLVLTIIALGILTALAVISNKNNVTIATQWQDWLKALKMIKDTGTQAAVIRM